MTTTFATKALLEAAKSAVANMEAELADYDARVEEYKAKHSHRWVTDRREHLKIARDRITKALAKGGTVTLDDVGGSVDRILYGPPSSYDIGKAVGYLNNDYRVRFERRIDAYRGVVKMLETVDGESLSINQFKSLGLSKVGELFRIAANNGGVLYDNNPLI